MLLAFVTADALRCIGDGAPGYPDRLANREFLSLSSDISYEVPVTASEVAMESR